MAFGDGTKAGMACGQLIGGIGGGAAAIWAATQVWPLITSAVPGGGGVILAIMASVAMCGSGCGIGASATACGCCIVGSCSEASCTLFGSKQEERSKLTTSDRADYSSTLNNIVALRKEEQAATPYNAV
jgi:hypothetical protein